MKKLFIVLILLLSISFTVPQQTNASSAGDDGSVTTPTGGGGGSSPNYYDYYIPLVFSNSHPLGESQIVVWIYQPSVLITSFALNEVGINAAQIDTPTKIVLRPSQNDGLTNGSLIRTTSPSLVVGQRNSEDITADNSFGYSILPRRMMGFEYYAPFDGYISLVTLNQNTEIRVTNPSGEFRKETIIVPGETLELPVEKGAYINSSFPTNAAFISYSEGQSASMAVPRYLHGSEYLLDPEIRNPRENETDRSYITVNPSEPTPLQILYSNGEIKSMDIFGTIQLSLTNIVGLKALRGTLEVNLRIKYAYGGQVRSSTLQLIAAPEMRAAEIFGTPADFSTHFVFANDHSKYNSSRYLSEEGNYSTFRHSFIANTSDSISIVSAFDAQFLWSGKYLFSYISSPGGAGHPMSPSMTFLNIPLNPSSLNNITGVRGTWYRFANLAIDEVDIVPGPLEEYTGQTIYINIISNGSLPASSFRLEISIDDEIIIDEEYDFLQVNDSLEFRVRKFLNYGKEKLKVSIALDADDEVNEINEDDNDFNEEFEVSNNIRLRWSIYGIILIILVYFAIKIRNWVREKRKVNRAHVDAIISFEEEE